MGPIHVAPQVIAIVPSLRGLNRHLDTVEATRSVPVSPTIVPAGQRPCFSVDGTSSGASSPRPTLLS